MTHAETRIFNRTVVVAALGYFVDIYDLVLFSIVRIPSLKALGLEGEMLLKEGVNLLNMQMAGMLLGGIIWGVLGDKRGRLSVLFGSILMYSLANIVNAFVTSVEMYKVLRFIAGVGLAGELGAAITLVSEVMPKESRGIGTSVVAGIGVSGAIVGSLTAKYLTWQTAYIVGGVLGLLLLALRFRMLESTMFNAVKAKKVISGNFLMLFTSKDRLKRYLSCILIGLPTWYVVGILVTFSPEIARQLGATGEVSAGTAILFAYLGLVFGDFASGFTSQLLKSRKQVILIYEMATLIVVGLYLFSRQPSPSYLYFLIFLMGFASGYWAIFVQIAAEQFGTNLRATVATTVPNFVRGAVVLLTLGFQSLKASYGMVDSALIIGLLAFGIALTALLGIRESFGKNLDYLEVEKRRGSYQSDDAQIRQLLAEQRRE